MPEIRNLPHKWIRLFYIYQKAKEAGIQDRRGVNEFKASAGKPGGKRQVITDPRQIVASNSSRNSNSNKVNHGTTSNSSAKSINSSSKTNKGVKK